MSETLLYIVVFYLMALPLAVGAWTYKCASARQDRQIESSLVKMAQNSSDVAIQAAAGISGLVSQLGGMVLALNDKQAPETKIIRLKENEEVVSDNGHLETMPIHDLEQADFTPGGRL